MRFSTQNTLAITLSGLIHATYGNTCTESTTTSCMKCITADTGCIWEPEALGDKCYSSTGATEGNGVYLEKSTVTKTAPKDYKNTHITPDDVTVRLRPGDKAKFTIKFDTKQPNPTDIYFLVDLTGSMKKIIDQLNTDMEKLLEGILELTAPEDAKYMNIGIGSFQEKPTTPFLNNRNDTHVFQNWYSLTSAEDNMNAAQQTVTKILNEWVTTDKDGNNKYLVSNEDEAEASLEALVQSAVCTGKIKWRPKARHVVIVLSDAIGHLAGEGAFAGILVPNSLECKMEDLQPDPTVSISPIGEYTEALNQDYPTVHGVASTLINSNVQVMFTHYKDSTSSNSKPKLDMQDMWYNSLVNVLGPGHVYSSYESETSTSEGLKATILRGYKDMTAKVTLVADTATDQMTGGFTYTIQSRCGTDKVKNQNFCANKDPMLHKFTEVVEFPITVNLDQYLNDAAKAKGQTNCPDPVTIKFSTPGFGGQEFVTVVLESKCTCECKGKESKCKTGCGDHGQMSCAECYCDEGWIGTCCECDKTDISENDKCYKDDESEPCSGKGECYCGKCYCGAGLELDENNKYCENTCDACKNNGQCKNGTCKCKGDNFECECEKGYAGKYCQCTSEGCKTPTGWDQFADPHICYEQGECVCKSVAGNMKEQGGCNCKRSGSGGEDAGDKWYFEDGDKCKQLHVSCARVCNMENDECNLNAYKSLRSVSENLASQGETQGADGKNVCTDEKYKKCIDNKTKAKYSIYYFFVDFADGGKLVYTSEEFECNPEGPNVLLITLITLLATLALGILIIIIMKLIVEWLNRTEMEKHNEQERTAIGTGRTEVAEETRNTLGRNTLKMSHR